MGRFPGLLGQLMGTEPVQKGRARPLPKEIAGNTVSQSSGIPDGASADSPQLATGLENGRKT